MRLARGIGRVVGIAAVGMLLTGCFTMEHRLPPGSYFGTLPAQPGERLQAFDAEASKNFALAGVVPYTSFGAQDLIPKQAGVKRIQGLGVETRFSEYDVFISIIPGVAYVYYVWAPRTVRIRGQQVLSE